MTALAYLIFRACRWWIERTTGARVAIRRVALVCTRCGKDSHLFVYPADCCANCYLKEI